MDWNKKDIKNICKIVAFGVILYWVLGNIQLIDNGFRTIASILKPFIIGIAIAFIINIPMSFFERKFTKSNNKGKRGIEEKPSKLVRALCILISLIIIVAVIIGIMYLVVPELIDVISEMISYLPEALSNSKTFLGDLARNHPEIAGSLSTLQSNLENMNSEAVKNLTSLGTTVITKSFSVITSTVKGVVNLLIAIIFAIYLLLGKEKIFEGLTKMLYAFAKKDVADKIYKVAIISKDAFYNFVTGQFLECLILGSLCAIGMAILRMPYAATVGALVAVTAFVPIVGAFVGGFIGFILILPVSLEKAIAFIIFFIILQQIEGNIIYPRVVGNKVGLPGVIVLIAVAIGSGIGGVVGMVICLPITSVIYILLKEFTEKRLEEKRMSEQL